MEIENENRGEGDEEMKKVDDGWEWKERGNKNRGKFVPVTYFVTLWTGTIRKAERFILRRSVFSI